MGQKVTLGLHGRLQLSIDGSNTPRPVLFTVKDLEVDLGELMRKGQLRIEGDKARLDLTDIVLQLTTDAEDLLRRATGDLVQQAEDIL